MGTVDPRLVKVTVCLYCSGILKAVTLLFCHLLLCDWRGRSLVAKDARRDPPCHSGCHSFYCNRPLESP